MSSLNFRLTKTDETKKHFLDETKHNYLISKKCPRIHKN